MVYQFRARRIGSDRLVLGVSFVWRVIFFVCALFLAAAGFSAERIYALPAAGAVLSILAVLYDERWTFARTTATVESRIGLLPVFFRRRSFALGALDGVILRQSGAANPGVTTGGPAAMPMVPVALKKRFARLSLRFCDESGLHQLVTVQTESNRRSDYLRGIGQAVAEFCAVPFESAD